MNRYLIANWKMNVPPEGIAPFLTAIRGTAAVVAPPFVYIKDVVAGAPEGVRVAGQNCGDREWGAFTGEVSAPMLRDCGVRFVILGHSERRNVYGESDALIARKLARTLENGLTPVLCIGENQEERDRGRAEIVVSDQLQAAAVPELERATELVIAYEPVWAIGTGRNASAETVAAMSAAIRQALARHFPVRDAAVLYGGSVTPDNVDELVADGGMDGFLVGGASLDSRKFLALHAAMARP